MQLKIEQVELNGEIYNDVEGSPMSIINFVTRSKSSLIIPNAQKHMDYRST